MSDAPPVRRPPRSRVTRSWASPAGPRRAFPARPRGTLLAMITGSMPATEKRRERSPLVLSVLLAAAATASGGGLEDELANQLRGAWCLTRVESFSACGGGYTNNRVTAGGVTSKGRWRFAPGELVKIDKVDLKRARIDLLLQIAEPVLEARIEGPFELYDELSCRVELMVELPRELVKAGDAAEVLEEVARVVERYPSLDAARAAERWNGRRRDPYPADYELTLARYEVWKVEQLNAEVAARMDAARQDAARLVDRMGSDPSYLAGFGAGVERGSHWDETDCEDLVDEHLVYSSGDTPEDVADERAWERGFRDGQALAFAVLLGDRLAGCFVPVPAVEDLLP